MNRLALANAASTRRHLVALLVTGLVALPLSQARAAGAATPAPAIQSGRVVDLGSLEGIVVTPHGNYSRSAWDARQRRLAARRLDRLAARATTLTPVAYGTPDSERRADGRGVLATLPTLPTLPSLPAATLRAVTVSLPTPSAGI